MNPMPAQLACIPMMRFTSTCCCGGGSPRGNSLRRGTPGQQRECECDAAAQRAQLQDKRYG